MSTPHRYLQDRTSCSFALVAILSISGQLLHPPTAAFGRELPGQARAERLRACPQSAPDDYAMLPDAPSQDEDDDEDDDDEDEDATSVGPGWLVSSHDCIFPSLEITSGRQITRIGLKSGKLPGDGKAVVSSQLNTTLGFTHVNHAWAGGLVTTIRIAGAGDASLSQASIHSMYFGFGIMGSRFDVWAGDEFSFRAIAPSQSPTIFSVVPWRSDTSILTLSLEDPSFRRVSISGYGPYRAPDVVARWAGRLGPVDLTLSAAAHQTNLEQGGTLQGYAGLASVRLNVPKIGDGSYVIAQASAANKALGFLGIHTASNAFGFNLPGALNAATAEAGKGVAGALVGFWQHSETVSYASYLTGTKLTLPGVDGGKILSWRTAINATWTPIEGLAFAVEAGYARVRSDVPIVPSVNAKTILVTVTRTAM